MSLLGASTIRKSELAEVYGISLSYLGKLLNRTFYNDLTPLGYTKKLITLSPVMVRKFIELYGEPLTEEDYQVKLNLK